MHSSLDRLSHKYIMYCIILIYIHYLFTDIPTWRQAIRLAVIELRRMGLHGLTQTELHRYKQSLLTEAAQTAAQYGQMDSETVLGMYEPVLYML
jgi:hypothetical protein